MLFHDNIIEELHHPFLSNDVKNSIVIAEIPLFTLFPLAWQM